MAGCMELPKARVRWFLSVDGDDLPQDVVENGGYAFRSMQMDGEEIEFSKGFTDLHTRVYQEIIDGNGLGTDDAANSIECVYDIRTKPLDQPKDALIHPYLN
jgi:UDP-N-acetyl-2-amino-2-deoxyglucuronate dehydrogenase